MPAKGKGWDGISGLETIQPRPSGKTGMAKQGWRL